MNLHAIHPRPAACLLGILLLAPLPGSAQEQTDYGSFTGLKNMNLEQLLEVEISSVSGFTTKLKDAPSAIQVINSDDIARSTAITLPDALRRANNLNIASKNPHDWAVSARGFNANVGNKLLVLMDGRSVYTPLFAGVFWSSQDYVLPDIDQVEVISGPGGTLWGANAVNGVINIHTKNAADTQGLLLEAGAGDETEAFASVRYGGKLAPNVAYRVYAKTIAQGPGVLADGRKAHNRWDQAQAGFRVDVATAASDAVTLQGDYYSGDLDLQTGNAARLSGGNLLARWTRQTKDGDETRVQAYFDRTTLSDPFAASPFAPAGFLKDALDTYDFQVQHSQHLGEHHRLAGGIGYRHTRDNVRQQAPNVAFLPAHLTQDLPSAFLQDEIRLTRGLALTIGSKFEHNDYTGYEYEPNARLQWKPSEAQTWWAAVSRAVRMPSRFDRDLYEPAPPKALIVGNNTFRSETVLAYEAGHRRAWNSRFTTSAALFYNRYDKLRSWGITPVTTVPVSFKNDLEATTYGAEFNADFQVASWWRLNAGYNYLHEAVRVKAGGFDLQNALDETADPRHQAALHSYMDWGNRWRFDAGVRWVDALRVNNSGQPGRVPAYAEVDLRLAWQLSPSVELSLVGRNLLHAHHAEYGPPTATREELQRSIFAKITWRWKP